MLFYPRLIVVSLNISGKFLNNIFNWFTIGTLHIVLKFIVHPTILCYSSLVY
jgi:hypothetical protein